MAYIKRTQKPLDGWQDMFEPMPNSYSGKVRCKVCHRDGYQTRGIGWQRTHLQGHVQCDRCGKWRTKIDERHYNSKECTGVPRPAM